MKALVPRLEWVKAAKAGEMPLEEYRQQYLEALDQTRLGVGRLIASTREGNVIVASGDTLVCSCGRAHAKKGRCHRVWAARTLHAAGWNVVLDGASHKQANLTLPRSRVAVHQGELVQPLSNRTKEEKHLTLF